MPASSGGPRPRPPTPIAPPSWRRDRGYESCEPGYATFIEALGQVYCGNLARYVELTRDVAALPGTSRAYGIAAYIDGLQSAGRVDEALELTEAAVEAARELGNPYWVAYTSWIVGLAWSKADPQRALETWDEAVAYIGEHDVRFFEGFMARDAALLHTSDGQLETALTLFGASIEAFLRAGAVAQLMITLASLPALFERLDRPAVAGTLLGAMAREPASFHHVPSLADLGQRLRDSLGDERPERWAATGAAMDLQDAAAYALNQIDVARQALAVAGQQGALAGLTARETAGAAADRRRGDHARDVRTAVHLGEDRRQPHPAHLHEARRDQSSGGHPVGARARGRQPEWGPGMRRSPHVPGGLIGGVFPLIQPTDAGERGRDR